MAQVRQDNVQVNLKIMGAEARTELDNLQRKADLVNQELKTMKKGSEEFIAKQKELNKVNADMSKLRTEFGLAGMSLQQLQRHSANLARELRSLTPGTESFINKSKEFTDVQKRISDVNKEIKGVGDSLGEPSGGGGILGKIKGLGPAMLAAFSVGAVIEAGRAVFNFGVNAVKAYNSSAQAAAQLEATLKSTGHAAGLTRQEIDSLATDRAKITLFDDDDTVKAASLLLTFTQIKKGVFEEALPAIQDLATKMGGDGPADLNGATIQVGKALNDPIAGITALSRVGVSFTEQQKELIKQMVKTGDVAGAQKLILSELKTEFGGSAEAAAKAGTGGFTILANRLGGMQEAIGGFITKGLEKLGAAANGLLNKLEPVFSYLYDLIAPVFSALGGLARQVYTLLDSLGIIDGIITVAKVAFGGLMLAITGVVKAIDGIVKGVQLMVASFEGNLAAAKFFFSSLKQIALSELAAVGDVIAGIFSLDTDRIQKGFEKGKRKIAELGAGMSDAYRKAFNASIDRTKTKEQDEAPEGNVQATGYNEYVDKEAEKKRKAQADKLRKQQEKDQADALRRMQDAQVAAIKDDEVREVAAASLKANREIAEIEKSLARDETKRQATIALQERLASEVAAIEEKYAKIREEQHLKEQEQRRKQIEAELEARRKALMAEADLILLQAQGVADRLEASQKKKWFLTGADRKEYEAAQQGLIDAQANRLKVQSQMEIEEMEKTNEEKKKSELKNFIGTEAEKQALIQAFDDNLVNDKILKEADLEAQKDELRRKYIDEQAEYEMAKKEAIAQASIQLLQGGLQAITDFTAIAAQKEIAQVKSAQDEKVKSLKFELNSKRLNQEEYQAAVQVLEEQQERKTREIKRRQAATDKAVRLGEAVINTAVAVTAAMAKPAIPPFPSAIAAGIMGGLQIAKIAATPLQYLKGGAINPIAGVPSVGQTHDKGGIKMLDGATGQVLGEWERGEPYMILSRNTYSNNREIVDSLLHSSLYRNGAPIVSSRRYEDGGTFSSAPVATPGPGTATSTDQASDLTGSMLATLQSIDAGVKAFPTLLKAYVSLTDLNQAQDLRNEIDTESSFG